MIFRPDFSSKDAIRRSFDSIVDARPSLEQDTEILPGNMVRSWFIPYIDGSGDPLTQTPMPNERLTLWRVMCEPKMGKPYQRDYGDGYLALKLEYDLIIGEDVPAAMRAEGCKLPGLVGYYDMGSSGFPTEPSPSPYGVWALLLRHGPIVNGQADLDGYGYFVADPRGRDNLANVGMYGGSGNQHGPLPTSGKLKVGQKHTLGVTCIMNTLEDETLILPAPFGNYAQDKPAIDAGLANARSDGLLRIELDHKVVGEWRNVGYRADSRVRIGYVQYGIYHGGHGPEAMVSARCHYDHGNVVITDEVGDVPQQQPPGDTMDQQVTLIVPAGTVIKSVETPDGKPPVGTDQSVELAAAKEALGEMTTNRDQWKAFAEAVQAKAADAGDDPKPPVV